MTFPLLCALLIAQTPAAPPAKVSKATKPVRAGDTITTTTTTHLFPTIPILENASKALLAGNSDVLDEMATEGKVIQVGYGETLKVLTKGSAVRTTKYNGQSGQAVRVALSGDVIGWLPPGSYVLGTTLPPPATDAATPSVDDKPAEKPYQSPASPHDTIAKEGGTKSEIEKTMDAKKKRKKTFQKQLDSRFQVFAEQDAAGNKLTNMATEMENAKNRQIQGMLKGNQQLADPATIEANRERYYGLGYRYNRGYWYGPNGIRIVP